MKTGFRTALYFIFSAVVLLVSLITSSVDANKYGYPKKPTNDLIKDMCQKTPNPSTCESDLRSDPRSTKSDPKSLTLILIDQLKSRFTDSLAFAQNMTKSTHEPDTVQALNKCVECYTFVINISVKSAVHAIEIGQPTYAYDAMDDAGSEAGACLTAFHGKEPESFVGRTRMLQEISSIAAALVKAIM